MTKFVYNNKLKSILLSKPKMISGLFFAILIIIAAFVLFQRYEYLTKVEEENATQLLNFVEKNIEQTINAAKLSTITLALSINDKGEPVNFESIGKQLVDGNVFIDGIQLVPNGVIKYVYPYQVNKAALEYNILEDPKTSKEAFKAIELKSFYVSGPFTLKQGGVGIVARLPIFRNNRFWGFSAAIIYLNTLIKNATIDTLGKSGFYFQLSKVNPNTLVEENFLPIHSNSKREYIKKINFPESNWNISIMAVNKYQLYYGLYVTAFISLLASFSISLLLFNILVRPAKLEKLVLQRTYDLEKSENEIIQVLQKYQAIFNSSFQFTGLITLDGKLIEANQTFLQYINTTIEQIRGVNIWEINLWHVDDERPERIEKLKKAIESAAKSKLERYEIAIINANNEIDFVDFSLKPIINDAGKVTLLIAEARIITEQKNITNKLFNANKELIKLSSHLLEVREEERTKVARDIHDDLGQHITGLKMDLVSFKSLFYTAGDDYVNKYQDTLALMDGVVQSVRDIIANLRPSILDDLGLVRAIDWQIQDFNKHNPNIKVIAKLSKIKTALSKQTEINLFRVIQECFTNISKHANATEVTVTINQVDSHYIFNITDNGIGFNKKQQAEKSFGILGMKERVQLLNGSIEIKTKINQGTQITVSIPI